MAAPADAIFVDGEVHVRPGKDRTEEALAVRDGTVCRVADTYEVEFLEGIETRRVDLDGRTVVPGFVDGYARLSTVGRQIRGVDDRTGSDSERVPAARENLTAAFDAALKAGITTVHDQVLQPETARAYHELALAEELPIRARLHYQGDGEPEDRPSPLAAARRLGLVSGAGTDRLRIDALGIDAGERAADSVGEFLDRAAGAGFRVSAKAADLQDLEPLLAALEASDATRPRIWLHEAVPGDRGQRLAALGATVVGRPDSAAGVADPRRRETGATRSRGPQFGRLLAAGVPVGFGSNGARPAPLEAIERATGAGPDARLGVTEALRAATGGTGGEADGESSLGTLGAGTAADFVVLSGSPWEQPIAQLDVEMTVVNGTVAHETS